MQSSLLLIMISLIMKVLDVIWSDNGIGGLRQGECNVYKSSRSLLTGLLLVSGLLLIIILL